MNLAEILKMTTVERLQSIKLLWDSLIDDVTKPPSPDWHGDIMDKRRQQIEAGQGEFIPIEKLKMRTR